MWPWVQPIAPSTSQGALYPQMEVVGWGCSVPIALSPAHVESRVGGTLKGVRVGASAPGQPVNGEEGCGLQASKPNTCHLDAPA